MAHSHQALQILQPRWDHLSTSADQNNSTPLINGPWGISPGIKLDDTLRIGFQNAGGLPESPSHPKNDAF
jgi:hypothetical protein